MHSFNFKKLAKLYQVLQGEKDRKHLEFSYIAGGSILWYNHFGKQPDIKQNMLYDSISMQLEKILMQSIGTESRSMVAKDQDWGNIL